MARKEKHVGLENDYVDKIELLNELAKERIAFLATFKLPGVWSEDMKKMLDAANGTTTDGDGTAAGTVEGNGNEEKTWNFLAGQGFSPAAIAGIMGNLKQESGIDPKKIQKGKHGPGPGTGLCQWEKKHSKGGGRWEQLVAWAKGKGLDEWAIETQLQYLMVDLQQGTTKSILNGRFGGMDGLKKMTDYKKAANAFEESFERAGKPMMETRYKYAKDFYDKWGKTGPSSSTTAKGDAKKVIESAETWLKKSTKYTWGGGRNQADIKAGRFDCSSFCRWAFAQNGYYIFGGDANTLAGSTRTLISSKALKTVSTADLKPGDLVFFDTNREYGHVTIYLGDNKCIGCQSSKGVSIVDMNNSYYKPRISKTHRRVL